jgi:ABC-type transport system involved in multi-copper enzyme maturation permease subunit
LLSSELLKLRTTRPPWILVGITVVAGGLIAAAMVGSGSLDDEEDIALVVTQGAAFFSILATIVGLLIVTNEYRHGTVMTTFLAEPHRARVLGAKLAAALLAGAAYGTASLAATAAVALPWLSVRDQELSLVQGLEGSGRVVLAFALAAALGAAVGAIVQSQVGAIIAVFVWFLIVESIIGLVAGLLFGEVGEPDPVTPYLPGSAIGGVVGGQGSEFMLRGPSATLLAIAYVVVLALLGALSMTRRDP